jgi:hypothetical protein
LRSKSSARGLGFIVFVLVHLVVAAMAARGQVLDIPPRLQWDEKNGYCGECSVQQILLFFGGYASQYKIREIFDPTQRRDLWVENNGPVLKALRLTSEQWDYNQAKPQYKAFLVWMKKHIRRGHPVIMGVYYWDPDEPDPAYDHVVPAIGAASKDFSRYLPEDTLTFNDNYTPRSFTRRFSTLYDTRSMEHNGARYEYCIPQAVDYGCAVTGIRDDEKETRPVRVKVDRWDEPDPWRGQPPATLRATVTVRSLTAGGTYVLLRYDDYRKVPVKGFLSSAYSSSRTFTATGATAVFNDSFKSNGIAIYRCVPASK